jgi:hypothetical protein
MLCKLTHKHTTHTTQTHTTMLALYAIDSTAIGNMHVYYNLQSSLRSALHNNEDKAFSAESRILAGLEDHFVAQSYEW